MQIYTFFVGLGLILMLAAESPAFVCSNAVVEVGEECDDGNRFGGDGCASNCTRETRRSFPLDPSRSRAFTQLRSFAVNIPLEGLVVFTTGKPGADNGDIPLVVRVPDLRFDPIRVPGVACTCVRPREFPETFEFGPGNVALGILHCGSQGFSFDVSVVQDHNIGIVETCQASQNAGARCATNSDCPGGVCFTEEACTYHNGGRAEGLSAPHPGICNGSPSVNFLPTDFMRGSGEIVDRIGFVLFFDGGTCCRAGIDSNCDDPAMLKGPDGLPCTEDDADLGEPHILPGVTGTARVRIQDMDNVPGQDVTHNDECGPAPCVTEATGAPFDCDTIARDPNGGLAGGVIVSAFPLLDNIGLGDSLVTLTLATFPSIPACAGDRNGDRSVSVDELVRGVGIALGTQALNVCPAFDRDSSNAIEVNELVLAVNAALSGC